MRKSVSVAFFSLMSTLLIFGTVIMGGSELVLFSNYFAQERYDVLDEVVNVAQRTASHLVQEAALPEGEELEALNTKLELIGESAEVYLFFTDCDGNVVLASDPDDLAGDVVEASVLEKSAKAKENYHIFGTLDGVLTEKSYISVHEMRSESGECTGYLFLYHITIEDLLDIMNYQITGSDDDDIADHNHSTERNVTVLVDNGCNDIRTTGTAAYRESKTDTATAEYGSQEG